MPENSAYDYEYQVGYADELEAETAETNSEQTDSDPQIEHFTNNQKNNGSMISIILISLLAALLLGSVIYSLNRRNTMYNKASAANSQLELVQAENVRLQSELDSRVSAKNVEDYAENVLGMQKIDSSQIKYIKIQTSDVVNIPEKKKGLVATLKSLFDRCVEYFRR